ncbi:hypothetical protein [Kangiella shandongensis]|uniref:hypothetical protein n=1 Tax=Kangiella shandongensis TaxID=2763258 RepID=UPI001CBB936F|nr:hypothetical protein [Kangiella shandongensis]
MDYLEEKNYLWDHFKFNAEQRLKAFHFFVTLTMFVNGGAFAAFEKDAHPVVLLLIGGLICILAVAFAILDMRSQVLLKLTIPGLIRCEEKFSESSRLFALDEANLSRYLRYTFIFRTLFVLQGLFGLAVISYSLYQWF